MFANVWNASCIAATDFFGTIFLPSLFSKNAVYAKTFVTTSFNCSKKDRFKIVPLWKSCHLTKLNTTLLLHQLNFQHYTYDSQAKLWIKFLFLIVDISLCYKYTKWKRECSYLLSHLRNNVPENCPGHISSSKSLKFYYTQCFLIRFEGQNRSLKPYFTSDAL